MVYIFLYFNWLLDNQEVVSVQIVILNKGIVGSSSTLTEVKDN